MGRGGRKQRTNRSYFQTSSYVSTFPWCTTFGSKARIKGRSTCTPVDPPQGIIPHTSRHPSRYTSETREWRPLLRYDACHRASGGVISRHARPRPSHRRKKSRSRKDFSREYLKDLEMAIRGRYNLVYSEPVCVVACVSLFPLFSSRLYGSLYDCFFYWYLALKGKAPLIGAGSRHPTFICMPNYGTIG